MKPRNWLGALLAVLIGSTVWGCAQQNFRPDYDPLEPMNRKIFWFNDQVDTYVLEPAAKGWDWALPVGVQRAVSNFFQNLRFPIVTINDVLQGKLKDGASDVGRFTVNTTVGLLGLFDPASYWGLAPHTEDFGQTLGVWGLSPGAYLVLPLLGPSNPRDTVGLVGDYGFSVLPFFVNQFILFGARSVDVVNTRAHYLNEIQEAKHASLDYYTFVRNAYFQRRKALIKDRSEVNPKDEEDIYQVDEDLVQ